MTHAERKELRDKHRASDGRNEWWNKTGEESPHCDRCGCGEYYVEWPCDVIKVLDATEPAIDNEVSVSGLNDNLLSVHCDHWVTVKRSNQYGNASSVPFEYWTHNYCPKCGEKL